MSSKVIVPNTDIYLNDGSVLPLHEIIVNDDNTILVYVRVNDFITKCVTESEIKSPQIIIQDDDGGDYESLMYDNNYIVIESAYLTAVKPINQ